jgi:hypothetical protein
LQLQEDLHQLEKWGKTWQMSFNADKCFTLNISKKQKQYFLESCSGQVLIEVYCVELCQKV